MTQRPHAVSDQLGIQDGVGSIRIRTEQVVNLARNLPPSGAGDASKLRALSTSLAQLSVDIAPADDSWRDGVLDKWGRKIAAAEGGGISATTFKAFDSSTSGLLKHTIATGKHELKSRKIEKDEDIDDAFVYNDADLYRALLVEIIDSGSGNSSTADAIASKTSLITKKKNSKKKLRNNANGRKLKYSVHEKLVGFLTPVPLSEPGPVNEILATLFGGR